MRIRSIVVPMDFSDHSELALDRAIELAAVHSAKLVLVHSYWLPIETAVGAAPWALPAAFVTQLQEGARAALEERAKRAAQAGVASEIRVTASPAVSAILEEAKALPADLIVMGTQGRTGVKQLWLGSVAERVVRLAPCPVLTVRAQQPS
jgi:universal stress protein A